MKLRTSFVLVAAFVVGSPALALAHVGTDLGAHHFAGGFAHPFTGWDHILFLVGVGLWAGRLSRRARWILPSSVLVMTVAGALLASVRVTVTFAEIAILGSVLAMGVMLLSSIRPPTALAAVFVGALAVFHGYAHVADLSAGALSIGYGVGFLCASAVLLAGGVAAAEFQARVRRDLVCGPASTPAARCRS